jgi:hypothetical protein
MISATFTFHKNNMKILKISIIAVFAILPFTNFAQQAINFESGYTEVFFSNKLDINDLAKIETDLSEKGINLNYNYLKFAKDGKLVAIEYHVTAGKVGAADKTEDTNVAIGFIVNTDPHGKYGIIAGQKESIQKRRIELEKKN